MHGMMRNAYNILVGKLEWKRPKCRWENDINMYLRELGVDWINLTQARAQWWVLVNTVLNLQVQ
jgi:hypothetical protein